MKLYKEPLWTALRYICSFPCPLIGILQFFGSIECCYARINPWQSSSAQILSIFKTFGSKPWRREPLTSVQSTDRGPNLIHRVSCMILFSSTINYNTSEFFVRKWDLPDLFPIHSIYTSGFSTTEASCTRPYFSWVSCTAPHCCALAPHCWATVNI